MNDSSSARTEILLRERPNSTLVLQLTNRISAQVQADVIAAIGACSAMPDIADEAREAAGRADAILINIGAPHAASYDIFSAALFAARGRNIPTVLDIVGCGFTSFRTALASKLLENFRFSVIKGNRAEISSLAGSGNGPCGVSAEESDDDMSQIVSDLALKFNAAVFCTGKKDFLSDGMRSAVFHGGSAMMRQISGMGCALGSAAAFLSVRKDSFSGAARALLLFRAASESAGRIARGPGTFYSAFLDALASLEIETVKTEAFMDEI